MPRAPGTITVTEFPRGFPPATRTIMSVVAVAGYSRYAAVFFFRAKQLDDPDGLLDCTRAMLRHVKLRPPPSHVGRRSSG